MVTVTSLDQYKSKIAFAGTDNDAAVLVGVDTALLGKSWAVYDALANSSGYQSAAFGSTLVGAGLTGLANNATLYAATITVDGVAKPISVMGSAAQTFTTLVSEINTDLGASAVASLSGSTILVTSATTGLTSTVVMVDAPVFGVSSPLFASVSGFARFNSSVSGTTGKTYTAAISGGAESGFQEVNVGGNKLAASATGLVNTAAAIYKATITVDGIAYPISFAGNTAQTYTPLLSGLNAVLTTHAVAALVNGNVRVTSTTTGASSTVSIVDTAATHGTASAAVATAPAGTVVPGIAANTYDFDVTIDGGALQKLHITTVGGESYNAIAALMNAVPVAGASVAYVAGAFVVTSASTGVTSTAVVAAGTFGSAGGNLFAAIATASGHAVTFPAPVNGTSPVFSSLSGYVTVNAAVPGVGASTMGGYQNILVASNKVSGSLTGLSNNTAGYEDVVFVYSKVATDYTGLANDATAYTATITVDGVAKPISVVGSAAQTFTTLLSEINTDLGASATAALFNGVLRVTSATTGATSTVAILDTGAHPLFASVVNYYLVAPAVAGTAPAYVFDVVIDGGVIQGYQDVNVGGAQTSASATSLVGVTTYTATVTVNGVAHPVSVLGSTAQTYGALVASLQAQLNAYANVGLFGGNIRIQSRSTTSPSTVAITAGTLFAAPLAGFVAVLAAVPGVVQHISVNGSAAQTYGALITAVNGVMTGATIGLNSGNLRITSATTGPSSVVILENTATLFPALTDFNGYGPSVPGSVVTPVTEYYVVGTYGSGKFSYQRYATWNAGLHTGTSPGSRFGFGRTPSHAGTIFMYSGVSNTEALAFS